MVKVKYIVTLPNGEKHDLEIPEIKSLEPLLNQGMTPLELKPPICYTPTLFNFENISTFPTLEIKY